MQALGGQPLGDGGPRPRLAPVTSTLSMAASFPASVIGKSATKRMRAGAMCAGSCCRAAAMISRSSPAAWRRGFGEHDLGGDERAGDRTGLGEDAARAHRTRRLFSTASTSSGCTLAPPTLMTPPRRPDEKTTIAAKLDHVAGVDEAVRVDERRRVRADAAAARAAACARAGRRQPVSFRPARRAPTRRRETRRVRRRRRKRRPPPSKRRRARCARSESRRRGR